MASRNILRGLAPIIDDRARVMILGSFPSEASLAAQQYYAHKQNQFWKILGTVIGQPLFGMEYADRTRIVQAAGIAIWDVYASCERAGSLDSAIRNGRPNDFAGLQKSVFARRHTLPRVCFNGQAAGRFAPQLQALGYETCVLPSTSPANATWSFALKLEAWRSALSGLAHGGGAFP